MPVMALRRDLIDPSVAVHHGRIVKPAGDGSVIESAAWSMFSHRTIDVPACFISGKSDWGVYQLPGALEMETAAQWRGTHLGDGAGHWVQQEQPEEVSRFLLQFIDA